MLLIPNRAPRSPGGISRRHALRVGGLALGGLGLADLLRAEGAPARSSHKSVIMIFLAGGPSHLDTFDLKPGAPAGIRGEFRPIATEAPGVEICEHLPLLARRMGKMTVVRSLTGALDQHAADLCVSGWPTGPNGEPQSGRPALGAVASRLLGPVETSVPPFVGIAPQGPSGSNVGQPAFLGPQHAAFRPEPKALDVLRLGVTRDRLADRKALLAGFDRLRREADAAGALEAVDEATRQAFEVLTSTKLVDALDLGREDPRLVARYGRDDRPSDYGFPPFYMDEFLVARRLVEAGARVVTVAFGLWDTHLSNFTDFQGLGLKYSLPRLDQGLSALVDDLHARGLEKDVAVVVWGEFGRAPRINTDGGRDHWPPVSCCLLAGGGFRHGQAIGSTDRLGESAKDRPLDYQNVFATLYHHLGIDPASTTLTDRTGRPQYLLEHPEVIQELVS